MALNIEIIPFTLRTGTGTQTVSHIRYPAIAAKGLVFFSTDTSGTNSNASYSFGLDDGATHIGCGVGWTIAFGISLNARAISSQYSLVTEEARVSFGGYLMRFRGYVSAMNVGSFTITTDLNDTPGAQWYAIMIGGTNVSCYTGWRFINSPGTEPIPFDPIALVKLSTINGTSTSESNVAYLTSGFAVPCNTNESAWGVACDGSSSRSFQLPDIIDGNFTGDSSTSSPPDRLVTVSSYPPSGFTTTGATLLDGDPRIGFMAIGGSAVAANQVIITQPNSTGVQNVTIDMASPQVVLFGSTCLAASANVVANGNLAFGVYDGSSQVAVWSGVQNGVTADQARSASTSKALVLATATGTGTSSVNADATVTLASTNVAMNWTTADGTARKVSALVLGDATGTGACGHALTDTLIITKSASVSGSQSFDFTTTGGLTPSTFSLIDGGTQTYTGVSPGTYGVTETVPDGWSASYHVSNGDPHTAIVMGAGDSVTVAVSNQFVSTTNSLRRMRRFALPYEENWQEFIKRFEVIMQMGVGTNVLDPTVNFRLSRDGGQTFGAVRTMTIGKAGEYMKRAYLTRLGRGRNLVVELYIDDPVFVAWCEATVQGSKGTS